MKVVIFGVARDCRWTIEPVMRKLTKAFSSFDEINFFVVESDSSDGTDIKMREMSDKYANFRYVSLGQLRKSIPLRTERIARARNIYVRELIDNPKYRLADYVVVADFDEVNRHIKKSSVESCFIRSDWMAVFANQSRRYFDIWALRHEKWSPGDCFQEMKSLINKGIEPQKAWEQTVASRQIKLRGQEWIEVKSAFGGLGIYKREYFESGFYKGVDDKGNEICEHVTFHENLSNMGAKLYINPKLLNSKWTNHTQHHRLHRKLGHQAKKWLGKLH